MKITELLGKTKDQLISLLESYKKELMNLRFQLVSGSLKNTSRIRIVRKTVAKIKTMLNNSAPKKVGDKNA